MNYTSRAIALTYIKHRESSIIVKIFSEEKGLQTFIVKGVRTQKPKQRLALFQPLQLLEITATYQKKNNLQYLKEVYLAPNSLAKHVKIKNRFLELFIAEVLSKILYENEQDIKLFSFIWEIKTKLISDMEISKNYPLIFLLNLSVFFGFSPSIEDIKNPYFDLLKGKFVTKKTVYSISREDSDYLKSLMTKETSEIPYKSRINLLYLLIKYYKVQHHELKNLTSYLIIEALR